MEEESSVDIAAKTEFPDAAEDLDWSKANASILTNAKAIHASTEPNVLTKEEDSDAHVQLEPCTIYKMDAKRSQIWVKAAPQNPISFL